jgi:protein O-GlcNAc transferase
LPNFLGYWTPEALPAPGPPPARSRGHITFGSFNRFCKVLEPVLRGWAQILRAVPNSRLVLKSDRDGQQAPILSSLAAEGIAAERITVLDKMTRTSHFITYQEIDIALDPFPHAGGMTTLDAFWMGVPVVTWPGSTISSRLAAATLSDRAGRSRARELRCACDWQGRRSRGPCPFTGHSPPAPCQLRGR